MKACLWLMVVALALALAATALGQGAVPPASATAGAQALMGQQAWVAQLLQRGLLWGLAVAFGTGFLVSFTPCVYPMIPITLGIIGGRDESASARRGFALSCVYVLGLSIVYATLGVIAGIFGAAVRSFLMSPYVMAGVAAIFALMGLSLLGLFEPQVPPAIATRMQSVGGKGVVGVLLMGMVSGIVVSPCVAAPLAGILAFVAVTGDALRGFLLLFTFAWGMGLLLIVVGTSAGALKALPRSGEWMVDVKSLLGFVFLGVALYFVRALIPGLIYYLGEALCLIAAGVAFGALDSLPVNPGAGARAKRGAAALIMALGFYVLLGTLWSSHLLLPPRPETGSAAAPAAARIAWQTDRPQAFAQARAQGKRVLVDFGAQGCVLCRKMEEQVFPQPEVVAAAAAYVPLHLDVTRPTKEEVDLQTKWNVVGYPTFVIAEADGTLVRSAAGFLPVPDFVAFLQGATAPTAAPSQPSGEK